MMEEEKEFICEWPVTVEDSKSNDNSKRKIHKAFLNQPQEKMLKRKKGTEGLARVAVAKWWRRLDQASKNKMDMPTGVSSNTLLDHIMNSPLGKEFVFQEIFRLEQLVASSEDCSDFAALGSFYEAVADYTNAEKYLMKAILMEPHNKEYKWLHHKIKRQIVIENVQKEKLKELFGKTDLSMPKPEQVESVNGEELTTEEFIAQFAMQSRPLIFKGLAHSITENSWTLDHLKAIAGNCSATLKKMVPKSAEWARLENLQSATKVQDYIENLQMGSSSDLYLFDWSIPINCPVLAEEIHMPKYFAGDFLQRTAPGSLYQNSWPSLFVSAGEVTSETHVDAFGSNFWMALFTGKKRWLFFPKEDAPLLYPKYGHSMDPVFDADLSSPNLSQHPLLHLTHPVECVLTPGDVLFVPAGCPHRVETLEPSIAISANYVDASNIEMVRKELQINALVDDSAEELLQQLLHSRFNVITDFKTRSLSWKEFKCHN